MDFRNGSGLAVVYEVGNEAVDLHFCGGRYRILAEKPSPAWQLTLIDSMFQGQREAAIRERVIGLNALAVYTAGTLIPLSKIVGIYTDRLAAQVGAFGRLFQATVVLTCEWLSLYWMYRRKVFLAA